MLLQCAAIAADYDAARQVELQSLLQDLSAHRAAGQAAHVLWLACRWAPFGVILLLPLQLLLMLLLFLLLLVGALTAAGVVGLQLGPSTCMQ